MGEIDIYLSPDLYNNNNFFKKTLTKPAKLQLIQICWVISGDKLTESIYTKIYDFWAGKGYNSLDVKFKDFVLPDFKIQVKLKDQSLRDSLKTFFEVSRILGKFKTEIVAPDDIKTALKGQSDYFKQLSQKCDVKPLTHDFENLFYTI